MTDEGLERKARREAEAAARAEDDRKALEICRAIRDDPEASDADRLQAIRLIFRIKNPV